MYWWVLVSVYINLLYIYFFETDFRSLPRLECNGPISDHRNHRLLGSGNSPASASWVAGITGMRHNAQLIFFVFLVEMRFHHVDQDGLNLLTSWSTRLEPPRPAWYLVFCSCVSLLRIKFPSSSMSLQRTWTHRFWWLHNIPWCICATYSPFSLS